MMLFLYPSKKVLKENIGNQLRFRETSMFGAEYRSTGTFVGANRPSHTGMGRYWDAEVTMKDDLIAKVK